MNESRKYPYHVAMDDFHILYSQLAFKNSRMHYLPSPQNTPQMHAFHIQKSLTSLSSGFQSIT